jgi:dienelactone hydrolase
MAARGGVRFGGLALSRDREGRPLVWFSALDDGRNALWVTRTDGMPRRIRAVTSARSRVNEYGGGAFWTHGESLFWVEDDDQLIHRLDLGDDEGCLVDRHADGATEGSDLLVEGTGPGAVLVEEPPAHRSTRYAAGVVEPGGTWMVVERELHVALSNTSDAPRVPLEEAVNDLVWMPTGVAESHPSSSLPSGVHTIVGDRDFVAAPTLSPDGRHLAWLAWDHPDMPWDSAELWAGSVSVRATGPVVADARRVAGGAEARSAADRRPSVSVCFPQWDPQGRVWWCDDRDDLWQPRCASEVGLPPEGSGDAVPLVGFGDSIGPSGQPGQIGDVDQSGAVPGASVEVGAPRWVSGGSRYGFAGDDLVLVETADGFDRVVGVGIDLRDLAPPGWVDTVEVGPTTAEDGSDAVVVAAVVGSPTESTAVLCGTIEAGVDSSTNGNGPHEGAPRSNGSSTASRWSRMHASPWPLPVESISVPEAITFPTGACGDAVAHGLFYPPRLEGVAGPAGDLPPLVVRIHGGPTASARAELSSSVQFWTTRGFAVVEVNYRGSTGYGRAFRDQLRGGWGEVEVQDCIAAAEFLVHEHRVDVRRCVIRGGSAGGLTALEAVAAEPTASGFHFAAATTLYGVTDLMALADDTHKFESRYLDGLIGPLPEAEAVYRHRSPLSHPERISSPVLVLQGLDDPVVPPSQAEVLVAALAKAGIDHEYRTYEGEGHGFRNEVTMVDALEAELAFYQRVLGLVPVT